MSLRSLQPTETNEFGAELTRAAHSRLGAPFVHHQSFSSCATNQTLPACMEYGMDDEGYDCSGFVLSCIADVVGKRAQDIAPQYRHVSQFDGLSEGVFRGDQAHFLEGTILILYVNRIFWKGWNHSFRPTPVHAGIITGANLMVNAHPSPKKVVRQAIISTAKPIRHFSLVSGAALAGQAWK